MMMVNEENKVENETVEQETVEAPTEEKKKKSRWKGIAAVCDEEDKTAPDGPVQQNSYSQS